MKKGLYIFLCLLLLVVAFVSFRLSIPFFEIKQTLATRQVLLGSNVNFDAGGVFVRNVQPNSPASEAGIQEGSQIIRLNGNSLQSSIEFLDSIKEFRGKPVLLTVCKSSVCKVIELTPRVASPNDEGPVGVVIQDVVSYNKTPIQIVFDQLYKKYAGQDFFSIFFGQRAAIVSWITLILGILSTIIFVKLLTKIIRK